MASVIRSLGITGISGYPLSVEVAIIAGLQTTTIVGLGDSAVKEAKDRMEACTEEMGYAYPTRKVVVNLSPSDIKKRGAYLDLPMLIGMLVESGQVKPRKKGWDEIAFVGGISTTGSLVGFDGVLPMAIQARKLGWNHLIVPLDCADEASLVTGLSIIACSTVSQVVAYLEERLHIPDHQRSPLANENKGRGKDGDYSDVVGHEEILPYLAAAVAGNHNLLLVGVPGCGKSLMAKLLPTILPPMSEEEILEVSSIYSIAGELDGHELKSTRPFRSPHYNMSSHALIGGGPYAKPGEVTLAHRGILFLDELPEFGRKTLESLRLPLEDKKVTISRVSQTNRYPSDFMLVAAMNPCPCGYAGTSKCECTPYTIKTYRQRISGPILDRIDMQKYVGRVDFSDGHLMSGTISSASLRNTVMLTRERQRHRFRKAGEGITTNSEMNSTQMRKYCILDDECAALLQKTYERDSLSVRARYKTIKLARTFADIDASERIQKTHLLKALFSRDLEREMRHA
ncbi:magnesium chelatase family protein [Sphaerochaeta associata]|uniref:YifB family Mg chelatase-like AAA ATPase n=1 Tax=Sphaerochaeta associata TaxID=1129264 RepID=A0ABY4DB16_9SPIR|nr:YifB family Mg chelatase-like AAA ATPase [Sphaerochaeta associata]UOM51469.1 YifB family Mg chelatase-like AAA ATPase [Sphaerochaeta associata]SMP61551.1 magnesium chelatase family protein [Sphaerochaeta associata]